LPDTASTRRPPLRHAPDAMAPLARTGMRMRGAATVSTGSRRPSDKWSGLNCDSDTGRRPPKGAGEDPTSGGRFPRQRSRKIKRRAGAGRFSFPRSAAAFFGKGRGGADAPARTSKGWRTILGAPDKQGQAGLRRRRDVRSMTCAGYGRDTPPLRRSLVGSEWLQLSPLEPAQHRPVRGVASLRPPFFGPGLARAKRGYFRSEPRGLLLTAGARLLWEG
jgi:hypothetical protein